MDTQRVQVTAKRQPDGSMSVIAKDEFGQEHYLGYVTKAIDGFWKTKLISTDELVSARTKWELVLWLCRAEGPRFFEGRVYFEYGTHALQWLCR